MKTKLYKIEKGIKVPAPATSHKATAPSRAALTMRAWKKGESFLIADELEAVKAQKEMRDFVAQERARKSGAAYVQRKAGVGVRIWRTS